MKLLNPIPPLRILRHPLQERIGSEVALGKEFITGRQLADAERHEKAGEAVVGVAALCSAGKKFFTRRTNGANAPGRLIGSTEGLTATERVFASELVGQGRTVEVVATGAGRTPDFIINGVRTELKTLSGGAQQTSDALSGAVANRVMNGRGQATSIIVDARGQAGMTREIAERGIRRTYGADNATGGRIQSIRVIGDGFDVTVPRGN